MAISLSRRALARAGAVGFTLALTLAPLLAPPPGGQALAAGGDAVLGESRRIVAVGGSVTEIVFALGEQDRLVARDSTSLFPDAALELPDVGYMRALSPEGVLSVDPDGILALEGSGPPEAVEVLRRASVPLVTIPETYDRAGILAKIGAVGKAIGADAGAAALAETVARDLDAATAVTGAIDDRKKVLFILSLQGGKVLASGTGTAADGIIALAGGVNAVTAFQGYKQMTDEAVIEAAPDVVLMMERGGDHDASLAELLAHPAIGATPAAETKNLVRMDGGYLLGFGPRTAAAARELATHLYGESTAH